MESFKNRLKINGYTNSDVNTITGKPRRKNNPSKNISDSPLFLSVPFISDPLDNKIKNVFKRMNVEVIVSHRSQT